MREEELRALLHSDPVGFDRYTGMLKREHARKTDAYERIERASSFILLPGLAGPFLLFVLGYLSAALLALTAMIVVSTCMEFVCFVLSRRAHRVAREISLVQEVARRPS
ncbi:hypothetical protein HY631_02210 [Candidatus Uhrbacteria bacterium]|nr:hypothetical protein [Candidatus Uhrbacteria bacterium]